MAELPNKQRRTPGPRGLRGRGRARPADSEGNSNTSGPSSNNQHRANSSNGNQPNNNRRKQSKPGNRTQKLDSESDFRALRQSGGGMRRANGNSDDLLTGNNGNVGNRTRPSGRRNDNAVSGNRRQVKPNRNGQDWSPNDAHSYTGLSQLRGSDWYREDQARYAARQIALENSEQSGTSNPERKNGPARPNNAARPNNNEARRGNNQRGRQRNNNNPNSQNSQNGQNGQHNRSRPAQTQRHDERPGSTASELANRRARAEKEAVEKKAAPTTNDSDSKTIDSTANSPVRRRPPPRKKETTPPIESASSKQEESKGQATEVPTAPIDAKPTARRTAKKKVTPTADTASAETVKPKPRKAPTRAKKSVTPKSSPDASQDSE